VIGILIQDENKKSRVSTLINDISLDDSSEDKENIKTSSNLSKTDHFSIPKPRLVASNSGY